MNNRNFSFPGEWKKIKIKKRQIQFAWGPTEDHHLKRIDRIEFTVASFVGGKGTLWIDDLQFEPLPPETESYPLPLITTASSQQPHLPEFMTDASDETYWLSSGVDNQWIKIDFTTLREFGGLQIDWKNQLQALAFEIYLSVDDQNWEKVYTVTFNHADKSWIRLPEAEARYLKINLIHSNSPVAFGIKHLQFLKVKESLTPNDFFIFAAKKSPPGDYPRYFLEQASYWTVTGVNNDVKEALINEEGMVEVDKACFSLEPLITIGDSTHDWSRVKTGQSLGETPAAR